MRLAFISLLGLCLPIALMAQSPQLDFLANHTEFRAIREMLPAYLNRQSLELLEVRRRAAAGWSAADAIARKKIARDQLLESIGGLPERTPLNARVVGAIEHADYRVEKIIFESQPGFYVTANLYLPRSGQAPYPAILYPLGHEPGGKSYPTWQQMLVTLAKRGYVALTWDPLGQGERVQLYDPDFKGSKAVQSTTEHTLMGTSALLVGDALARYTIWDGIRALDYLLSRPEVDAKRVGVSGNSGGGTHTTYLSALDDRLHVAAPSCYITSWSKLIQTIGPQDAEQCFPSWLARGMDFPDFLYAGGAKPFLILSAIRDFFPINGARDTFEEAKRTYALLNASEKISMADADDGHGFSKPRRLAAYRWFDRWLKGTTTEQPEPEVPIAMEEDLYCTPTGQVSTSLGGQTVYSLNQQRAARLKRGTVTAEKVRARIGWEKKNTPLNVRDFGRIERNGYSIRKLTFESEPGIVMPSLLYLPNGNGRRPAVVVVHGKGKSAADADADGMAKAGLVVLAIDARGLGETRAVQERATRDWSGLFGDYKSGMTAILNGKTLTGMRAFDISRAVDLLASLEEVNPNGIHGLGYGAGATALLHAAVLDERIRKVGLERMLVSYQSVVDHKIHRGVFEQVVPGVLKDYDLPDLARLLSNRPVWITDAVDPIEQPMPLDEVKAAYAGAGSGTKIVRRRPEDSPTMLYPF